MLPESSDHFPESGVHVLDRTFLRTARDVDVLDISRRTVSTSIAPLVEEVFKSLVLVHLVRPTDGPIVWSLLEAKAASTVPTGSDLYQRAQQALEARTLNARRHVWHLAQRNVP